MLISTFAIFIIIETFAAADQFDTGERLCRFLKYCMSLVSGILVLLTQYFGGLHQINNINLYDLTIWALLLTLVLFFWPRVLARFGFYNRRLGDK